MWDDIHLDIAQLDACRGRLGDPCDRESDDDGGDESDSREEAEDILNSHQCRMHLRTLES